MSIANWISLLLVKSTAVLLIAGLTAALLRKRSAAARHAVWTVALVGLLTLPILSVSLPAWRWAVLPAAPAAVAAQTPATSTLTPSPAESAEGSSDLVSAPLESLPMVVEPRLHPGRRSLAWPSRERLIAAAPFAWALVAGLMLLRFALGNVRARRLVGAARAIDSADWRSLLTETAATAGVAAPPRLLESDEIGTPAVWGYREAHVLLPSGAHSWPEERKRAFLLHELAHVARRDCLTQALAAVVRAIYWPQPLVFWAVARLRCEAEHACDDRVLAAGTKGPDYAHHLLEAARTMQPLSAGFAGVAERSNLEERLLALLDAHLARGPLTRRAIATGVLLAAVVVSGVSALQPVARAAAAQILAALPGSNGADAYSLWEMPIDANTGKPKGDPIGLKLDPVPGVHVLSEDGSRFAFTSKKSGRGEIWLKDFKTGVETRLTDTPKDDAITVAIPVLSHDGRTVFYQRIDGKKESVYSVSTTGGASKTICEDCGWPTDVSPDGQTLILQHTGAPMDTPGDPGEAFFAVDLATGKASLVLQHHEYTVWRGHFSPDGKWLLFHAGLPSYPRSEGVGTIVHEFIVPFHGSTPIQEDEWIAITDAKAYSDAARWSPDGNLIYYVSDRDGARCIWAQRLDPTTKRPTGDPSAVLHLHSRSHSLLDLGAHFWLPLAWLDVSVGADKLIFGMGVPEGTAWASDNSEPPAPPAATPTEETPTVTGAAARVIPDTPAGRQFGAWLKAFNSGDRDTLASYLKTQAPARTLPIENDMRFRHSTGGFDFRRTDESTPTRIVALMQERSSDQIARFVGEVQPAPPHLVVSLNVNAVSRPADLPIARTTEKNLLAKLSAMLDKAAAEDRFSGALLVARNGQTLWHGAYGLADREKKIPNTLNTRFRIASMNKMFTAVATMQLVEAGKVKLDDPLGKYLTDYPNMETATKVTIHQLLTHTGGTGDFFSRELDSPRLDLRTFDDYIHLFGKGAPLFEPGTRYRYSNYGYVLLGAIIERASGQSYYDYVRDHVYKPAGMTSTGSEPEDVDVPNRAVGYMPNASFTTNVSTLPYRGTSAGGGYSTVGDLARFAEALLDHKLLSVADTDLVMTAKLKSNDPEVRDGYGFEDGTANGVRVVRHGAAAPGMNGDLRMYFPSGYVVVALSNFGPPAAQRISEFIGNRLPAK